MKLAIMQPYFFPYIGYFQLMNAVDTFVVYDDVQYTKKGWINRNRILINGKIDYLTIPLRKDSDFLTIKERFLAEKWLVDRKKLLNKIIECYRNAPNFNLSYPLIENCINYENKNLFDFLYHSLNLTKDFLGIKTEIKVSSQIKHNYLLKGEKRVIDICNAEKTDIYINPIGASKVGLYNPLNFDLEKIKLTFLNSNEFVYTQFNNPFVPWLSIIDVIMFNDRNNIIDLLQEYTLI